ncbi:MAG: EMC3/TMCO1 family protein [Nanoarchaeota archaeon]
MAFLSGFFDLIFGWAINLGAPYNLMIITFIITLFTTLIYKFTTNQERLKSIREEMKNIQNEIKGLKSSPEKMLEKQKQLSPLMMESYKHIFKPMLITFLPLILILGWLRETFTTNGEDIKIIFGLSWLWSYILFSVIFSIIIRKVLKVY